MWTTIPMWVLAWWLALFATDEFLQTDSELSQVERSVTPVRRRESTGPSELVRPSRCSSGVADVPSKPPADLLVELGMTDPFHDGQQPS